MLALLDLTLAGLVLLVAVFTVAARGLFAAVASYVAYGLLLALVWIRLYAPDVALTEAAVGSGVTGVLLVTAGKRLASLSKSPPEALPAEGLRWTAAALAGAVSVLIVAALSMLPDPAPSLATAASDELPGAGAGLGNPITAVLISYRSFDTMLEKVVLVLAIAGVWSVGTNAAWGDRPAPLRLAAPSPPMTLLAQTLAPLGVVIGIHIFWVGADAPGGAFQGGALLAAMWLLVLMARLADPPRVDSQLLRVALVAGPAVFMVVGVAGAVVPGHFFAYPPSIAKPLILFIEAVMVLSIACGLPVLVNGPPAGKKQP